MDTLKIDDFTPYKPSVRHREIYVGGVWLKIPNVRTIKEVRELIKGRTLGELEFYAASGKFAHKHPPRR